MLERDQVNLPTREESQSRLDEAKLDLTGFERRDIIT
jgi:hypothetical protein